jgi:hypothetical protein
MARPDGQHGLPAALALSGIAFGAITAFQCSAVLRAACEVRPAFAGFATTLSVLGRMNSRRVMASGSMHLKTEHSL